MSDDGISGRRLTPGWALRTAHQEVEESLAAEAERARADEAKAERERYERENLCGTCFHAPVCAVNLAAVTMSATGSGLVWIGRCGQYVELPSAPEPEPAE